MTTPYEIPLTPEPQTFSIALAGVTYRLTVAWNSSAGLWVLDIADADSVPLVQGLTLVTGLDLLEQYRHLGIMGSLVVQTDHNTDAPPTLENLGTAGRLYFVTGD